MAASAQTHPFTSFDAPDAVHGTFPAKINASGQIVGRYFDAQFLYHSFVRAPNGQITDFDPPKVTTSTALDINSRGQIVGQGNNGHAYLRLANGTFHEIDPPGAVAALASGINDSGTITGQYSDASNVWHGFILERSGVYTFFDAPDAGMRSATGTFPTGINKNGAIAGYYRDNSPDGIYHGFVRDPSGNIAEFDPPGILDGAVSPTINSNGDTVGRYDLVFHSLGFLRKANGVISTIDPPGALDTTANGINDDGVILGYALGEGTLVLGFRRNASGIYRAIVGPLASDFVFPSALNSKEVTGMYQGADSLSHGFVQ